MEKSQLEAVGVNCSSAVGLRLESTAKWLLQAVVLQLNTTASSCRCSNNQLMVFCAPHIMDFEEETLLVYRRYQDDERNRRTVEADCLKRSVYGALDNCLLPTARQNLTWTAWEVRVLRTYHSVLKLQIAQLRQLEAVGPDRFKLFVYGGPKYPVGFRVWVSLSVWKYSWKGRFFLLHRVRSLNFLQGYGGVNLSFGY